MRDYFERLGKVIVPDTMTCELNCLLWPCISISAHKELEMIFLECEAIDVLERKEVRKALTDFYCEEKRSSVSHNGILALKADGTSNKRIAAHGSQLDNSRSIVDQCYLFDSVLPKIFGEVIFQSIKDCLQKMCCAKSEWEHYLSFDAAMSVPRRRPFRYEKPEE